MADVVKANQVHTITLRKNTASNSIGLFVPTSGDPDTGNPGEAANLTAKVSVGGGADTTYAGATYFTETSGMPDGCYEFAVPTAATNGDLIIITFTHTTEKVNPRTVLAYTDPDWETDMLGVAFDSSTDRLEKLREYFDSNILPKLRAQASVTEFSGTGWLSELLERIRGWTDEPITSSKYTPTTVLPLIKSGIRKMFTEGLLIGDRPILVRYNVTIDKDVQGYVLPPNVSQIWRVAQIDSDTGRITAELYPTTDWDPALGFKLEGNMLWINSKLWLTTGDVYEVLYVPNGDIKPYKCTLTLSPTVTNEISADGLTVTFTAERLSSEDGSIDKRLNGYGGYIFRVLTCDAVADNVGQDRVVASSTINTVGDLVLTLSRPLNPIPDTIGEEVTCELIPSFDPLFEDALALSVARAMMVSDGNKERHKLLSQEFAEVARAFRMQIAKSQMRRPSMFDGRDSDNLDYAVVGGIV